MKSADLVHYKLHAEIDERHAQEFSPCWADGSRKYATEQGLEPGAYAFDRLYRDLLDEGQQRPSIRETPWPAKKSR